ncbi:MAG: carboxymuconolactone decarboxylase family protein [Gemmatimonadota bacterium]
MTGFLPPFYEKLCGRFPAVCDGHEAFAGACHEAGPLDPRTRHLVKLGIAVGARYRGAVQSQARQSLEAGAARDEIEHVALLAGTTVGFPSSVAALKWIDDMLEARGADTAGRA